MKPKIIRKKDKNLSDNGVISVRQYFNSADLENMSVSEIHVKGENKVVMNKEFDSMYYILEGEGVFVLEGVDYDVSKGDLVVIPRGFEYKDKGNLKMLCFNSPRWRPLK